LNLLHCHQQSASFSKPAASVGTKKGHKDQGQASWEVAHNHHFVFSQKLLDVQGCVGRGVIGARTNPRTTTVLDVFIAGCRAIISAHSIKTTDLLLVIEEQTPSALSLQHQKKKSTFS
jgi:hypothetical protein